MPPPARPLFDGRGFPRPFRACCQRLLSMLLVAWGGDRIIAQTPIGRTGDRSMDAFGCERFEQSPSIPFQKLEFTHGTVQSIL